MRCCINGITFGAITFAVIETQIYWRHTCALYDDHIESQSHVEDDVEKCINLSNTLNDPLLRPLSYNYIS